MKKNILLLLPLFFVAAGVHAQTMLPLFFMKADAQDQKRCVKDSCHLDKSNFYANIGGGANFLQKTSINGNKATYRSGYVFDGMLGYDWRYYGLRFEGEYAFRRNAISKIDFFTQGDSTKGHFQTSSYMANLLWDLPLCSWGCKFWNIQPYVGGGLGCDLQQMHASNPRIVFNQHWTHFSWQVMAGFAYPIFRNTEITLDYKFHQGGSHFNNNSVGFGIVYKFGYLK